MTETNVIVPGSKVKRGAIVVSGEATIEYPEKEKKEGKQSRFVKYQCPNKCLQPEDPDNPSAKRRIQKFWLQQGGDERGAKLTMCFNCQEPLVYVPSKKEGKSEPEEE